MLDVVEEDPVTPPIPIEMAFSPEQKLEPEPQEEEPTVPPPPDIQEISESERAASPRDLAIVQR